MPIYKGSSEIKKLYHGDTRIQYVYLGDQLIYSGILDLPVSYTLPTTITSETQVATATGATHTIYTITQGGFYRVVCQAGGGGICIGNEGNNFAGKISKVVYLYKNTKCLLWGATQGSAGNAGEKVAGLTGYPTPANYLGATGPNRALGASGGAGGGAAANGLYGTQDGGSGGGGAGFLAGTDSPVTNLTYKNVVWSQGVSTNESWTAGDFTVQHVYCRILCGGAGGNSPTDDQYSAGGAGGGAWGNSGWAYDWNPNTAIGNSWGQGGNSTLYSVGGSGAWCVMDFSCNQWEQGKGGGAGANTDGYCTLYRIDEYV